MINPVELPDCEFDAKLPLSRVAAEAGLRAVFGSQTSIHTNIERRPRIIRDLGDSIIGCDEDGLVRNPSTQYCKLRIEPQALEQIALWFAWGDDDAALPKTHPAYNGTPVHITGNPRADMLRPEIRPPGRRVIHRT